MAEPALKPSNNLVNEIESFQKREIIDEINKTHSEELIITLCGFIGTEIHAVGESLKSILENDFDYTVEIIKLSDLIQQYANPIILPGTSKYERTKKLIESGNDLRSKHQKSVLAELAIQKIAYERFIEKEDQGSKAFKSRRYCYIIDSIKNVDELELFKVVYRDIHYSIGIFSSLEARENHLKDLQMSDTEISSLIDRDSGEEIGHGQKVRDTFIQSDYFLRLDSSVNESIKEKLRRFLHLIFGSKIITPTIEETAMYHAASAANSSACLSRQVGAALTDKDGEILSIGWNDVPKSGGGLYQSSTKDLLNQEDNRCWNLGDKGCWNDQEKNLMANELVDILIKEGFVEVEKREQLYQKVRNSKIKSLVEFSRAIHAEMHAIISGSQIAGERVRGGNLYITTYPCHNCARHIIVAGIKKVYYIEPYKKSLTTKLHNDAITETEGNENKVVILMYDGVSPSRYMDLFKMVVNSRKDSKGEPKKYQLKSLKPKATLSLEAIPVLESMVTKSLVDKGFSLGNN